jgi:hypothetical protein
VPKTSASVLVALAVSGGVPKNNKAGNVISVPPPATALITPAAPAADAKAMTSVPDMLGASLAHQMRNSSPQVWRNTKHQAPEKSRNRNTKHKAPNSREAPSSKLEARAAVWSLELGISLVFGAWCLVFGFWDLVLLWSLEFGIWNLELCTRAHSFPRIEKRPIIFIH